MSKRRLLLADDSITIQKVVNLTFADEGFEVVTVGDGDAAMEKIAEARPDLILADVNMPGLDGYRICELIKQSNKTKSIPVILLVGSFEPFNEAEAKRVGADAFLTKPFQSIRHLVNRVSDLLDGDKTDVSVNETVNNFDDTLEMEKPKEESAPVENLSDVGMDDEMIQTNQIEILPVDEAQKFESELMNQSSLEDINFVSLKQPYNYQSLEEHEAENDWAKTQPLSESDIDQMTILLTETETISPDNKVEDSANTEEEEEEKEPVADPKQNEFSQTPPIESALALNFDDLNILELPQPETKSFATAIPPNKSGQQVETNKIAAGQTEEAAVAAQTENLSSEMIEAIADRISEKILDRLVERLAKQMAMEK